MYYCKRFILYVFFVIKILEVVFYKNKEVNFKFIWEKFRILEMGDLILKRYKGIF